VVLTLCGAVVTEKLTRDYSLAIPVRAVGDRLVALRMEQFASKD
jgi:hypothetical protein